MKCSAAKTCTGRSTATAVPGAFVPTALSAHRAPGTKFIRPAFRRVAGWPSTHSRLPCASHTARRCSPSAANVPISSRNRGITRASGCSAR
ncbi:hypothetical protein SAURM35S_05208 [Streptomyces aurantiogriseus]